MDKEVLFPLFTFLHKGEESNYYLCLWSNENSKTACGSWNGSFDDLLKHLSDCHKIKLKPGIDFCHSCEAVFENSTQAVEHYINHAIMYRDSGVIGEKKNFPKEEDDWFCPLLEKLREIRKELLKAMIFKENLYRGFSSNMIF